jgi:hypothetical protein
LIAANFGIARGLFDISKLWLSHAISLISANFDIITFQVHGLKLGAFKLWCQLDWTCTAPHRWAHQPPPTAPSVIVVENSGGMMNAMPMDVGEGSHRVVALQVVYSKGKL